MEEFLWESGFSNFGQNRNDRRRKSRLFGRHFETVQHFQFFFPELCFVILHTYMVQVLLENSGGKVVFFPLGHQRE